MKSKSYLDPYFKPRAKVYVTATRPDTRHKMRLVCVLFPFEKNTGRTDTTSYRDATAHLKSRQGSAKTSKLSRLNAP